MGDPSVQPVGRAPHALVKSRAAKRLLATPEAKTGARLQRREWLVRYGVAVGEMTAVTRDRDRTTVGPTVKRVVERTVREAGARRVRLTSHDVIDPARREIRAQLGHDETRTVHVGIGRAGSERQFGRRRMRPLVAVVATVARGRVLGVNRLVSK
jgi:hypothetical protein